VTICPPLGGLIALLVVVSNGNGKEGSFYSFLMFHCGSLKVQGNKHDALRWALKRAVSSVFTSYPASSLCNLLEDYLSPPLFLVLDRPFPSAFLPLTLYRPYTSQICHFSPKDGDSMFF
jgi:hypothetical protein